MELKKISIYNFRSISIAENIELSNYTILIGKNNEGKTNVLSAVGIAINSIENPKSRYDVNFHQRLFSREFEYNLERDYPVRLNTGNYEKMQPTKITMNFNFTDEERKKFKELIGIKNNGLLCLEIKYIKNENTNYFISQFLVKGKKGKGATTYKNNINLILDFISDNFIFTYIPAVRTSEKSMDILQKIVSNRINELKEDSEYLNALSIIESKENQLLQTISEKLKPTLKKFLPDISQATISVTKNRNMYSRNMWSLMIDDGNNTDISTKGDGVKSLAALALLKGTTANKGFVAIEEPESHLHSGAIHQLDEVLRDISKNQQVLITTHNSCFVNSRCLSSNIIVSNGKCVPATSLTSLRNELGISLADTLVISDCVIVVEGKSDCRIYTAILKLLSKK